MKKRYELACKFCGEWWPEKTRMSTVQEHFLTKHDTKKVALELIEIKH